MGVASGHLGDVGPGGEGALSRAGQDDAADGVVGVQLLQPVGQLGDERPVERVELVGAVDGGGGDGFVARDDDILLRHAVSAPLRMWFTPTMADSSAQRTV